MSFIWCERYIRSRGELLPTRVRCYFLAAVTAAGSDDAKLREAVARSIRGFYDAMEAGGQERGERSGDFYFVDGVALEDSDREVPLNRVRASLGNEVADRIMAMWDDVQITVR
jgi:hypothetical protein